MVSGLLFICYRVSRDDPLAQARSPIPWKVVQEGASFGKLPPTLQANPRTPHCDEDLDAMALPLQ